MFWSFTKIFTNSSFNPIHSLWLWVDVCVFGMRTSLRACFLLHDLVYDNGTSLRLSFLCTCSESVARSCYHHRPPGCVGVCGGARGDECEGMECLCALCIWTACPFSNNFARQKLKLRGNTASKVIIIICATEKSEFLFTLEPSSLSPALAYQSRGDDIEERSWKTELHWTRAVIAGMWLHSVGEGRKWSQGT